MPSSVVSCLLVLAAVTTALSPVAAVVIAAVAVFIEIVLVLVATS